MKTRFFADYDRKELNKRLNSIIDLKREDNFRTHLRQIALFKDEGKVSGAIKQDTFKIWTHEQGLSGATGIFYPIIEGRTKIMQDAIEINFTSKMNVIGRTVYLFILSMLTYAILPGIVIQENNELRYLIPRMLIGAILIGLLSSVSAIIYYRTSKIMKQHLIKKLMLSTGIPKSAAASN